MKTSFLTKSLHRNKGWQFDEVWWTDIFESGEVLMPEDIGSLSVTLFSFNWSLEMGKYDVRPWIVGLFAVFLFLISFSIAFSRKLKSALVEWFFGINSVIDLLSLIRVLFAVPYFRCSVHNVIRRNISIIFGCH